MEAILDKLIELSRLWLEILGLLVIIGAIYVKITPSKTDDEALDEIKRHKVVGPIMYLLEIFSPFRRKK